MALRDDVLVTGSWDATVKIWKCRPSGIEKVPLAAFVENDSEVKCIDINNDASLVIYGNEDGICFFFLVIFFFFWFCFSLFSHFG
jgi:WD40 repeat protein